MVVINAVAFCPDEILNAFVFSSPFGEWLLSTLAPCWWYFLNAFSSPFGERLLSTAQRNENIVGANRCSRPLSGNGCYQPLRQRLESRRQRPFSSPFGEWLLSTKEEIPTVISDMVLVPFRGMVVINTKGEKQWNDLA